MGPVVDRGEGSVPLVEVGCGSFVPFALGHDGDDADDATPSGAGAGDGVELFGEDVDSDCICLVRMN